MNFDTSDLNWAIFFCGTKRLANMITKQHDTYFGDEAMIIDWIFYHDAMYKFSIRHWRKRNQDQIHLAGQNKVLSKAVFSPERQTVSIAPDEGGELLLIQVIKIVPILGCSLELLDLLCQVVDNVYEPGHPNHLSESHLKTVRSLEIRLKHLEQRQAAVLPSDTMQVTQETQIAELFRLAAIIYLLRMAKGESETSKCLASAMDQALHILNEIEYCDRPWPLFIIGLESRTEEQRSRMVQVLESSVKRRPLGSMTLVKRMVPDAWTQQDLRELPMEPFTLYDMIIGRNRVTPCFT